MSVEDAAEGGLMTGQSRQEDEGGGTTDGGGGCRGRLRSRPVLILGGCCLTLSLCSITFFFILLGTYLVMEADYASPHVNPAPYPVTDDEGYYMAYKDGDTWVNWWSKSKWGLLGLLAQFLFTKNRSNIPSTEEELNRTLPVRAPFFVNSRNISLATGGVRATWLGHATVLAEVDSAVVIADPQFSVYASFVQWAGTKRYRPPACKVSELPSSLSAVVVSHNHYDHLDLGSCIQLHERFGDQLHWFLPKGIDRWVLDNVPGVASENVHGMVWWDEAVHPDNGAKFVLTPVNHWSRRGLFDENRALWGGWAVIGADGVSKFWHGGDTAYCNAFTQIGKRYGPFSLAAIPIGEYEPRRFMKYVHVNPEEAVQIHVDIRSKRSFGMHWGTFPLTYTPYLEPRNRTVKALKSRGIHLQDFQVPDMGDTVDGVT